jgi:hypothetical protein
MTDRPLDRRDELASALLDGEATDDPLAEDPTVRRRGEQLRAAAEQVRAPVPSPPAHARDAAVAAALDTLDPLDADPEPAGAPAPARWWHRRTGTGDRRLQLLGAAAAVLLVLAAIPLLANLSRTAEDDTAAVDAETEADALTDTFAGDGADDLATATADAAGPGDEMRQAAPEAAGAGGGIGLVDLGEHDDARSLAATALAAAGIDPDADDPDRSAVGAPSSGSGEAAPTTTVADDVRPCEAEIAALEGDVLLVGLARLGVNPVVVAVLAQPEGATVVVLDPHPPRCSVISEMAGDQGAP